MKPGVFSQSHDRRHRRRFGHERYDRHLRRRFLFLRFAGIFGLTALLILGGLATLAWLMTRWFTGDGQMPVLVWVGGSLLGVGLPLVGWGIARQLVLAHGGRIEVESQPGQGATFLVQLPAEN